MHNVSRDSTIIAFLDSVNCDLATPTDFMFSSVNRKLSFNILASNIKCDSIPIISNSIIETDSMKIGIFAIYTPDFVVKKNVNPKARLNMKVFEIAEEQAKILARKTDFVIMLSTLTKYVDNDVVQNIPVDAVISFDYQKKGNATLDNKHTKYFSILSFEGKYGKLRFEYKNGRLTKKWLEIGIK